MQCELFEYSDEDLDTGIESIDDIEITSAYEYQLFLDSGSGLDSTIGETVSQEFGTYQMKGEVTHWSDSDNRLELAHVGATDGLFHTFTTTALLTGQDGQGNTDSCKRITKYSRRCTE